MRHQESLHRWLSPWMVSAGIHMVTAVLLAVTLLPMRSRGDREILLHFSPHVPEVLVEELADPLAIEASAPIALPPASEALGEAPDLEPTPTSGPSGRGDGSEGTSAADANQQRSGEGGAPRASYFGMVAYGDRFVYVLDMSTSMNRASHKQFNSRFERAVTELLYSLDRLREDQYFYVVLFSFKTRRMFDEKGPLAQPVRATAENKRRFRQWIADVRPGSGTDPRQAVQMALRMNANAVFLLSDGEFNGQQRNRRVAALNGNPSTEDIVRANNKNRIPIHTLAFEDPVSRHRLKGLAEMTGGNHVFIKRGNALGVTDQKLAELWMRRAADATEKGDIDRSRRLYNSLIKRFPASDAAGQAAQLRAALDKLPKP